MELLRDPATLGFAIAAAALGLTTLVLLVAVLVARSRIRRAEHDRTLAERDRLDIELALGEQASRMRVIRELHDVAAASVSRLVALIERTRYAAADADAAARADEDLVAGARNALADLRRVTTLVRESEAGAAVAEAPAISTIDELVELMRESGLGVELQQFGEPLDLREGAELVVFRIVQQALENALQHGGSGTTARVTLRWSATGLQLLVDDDGTRAASRRAGLDPNEQAQQRPYSQEDDLAALVATPRGRGLSEMRERAELFGGVFTVHEVPGVGFSISAIFPSIAHHNGVHGVRLGGA